MLSAAILWLVIWVVIGVVGTWATAAGVFFGFGAAAVTEKPGLLLLPVVSGIVGIIWAIIWISNAIGQIVSIITILTAHA